MQVRVQAEAFDAGAELNAFAAGRTDVGAVVSFTGVVRDTDGTLQEMLIEHYPGMTEKAIAKIAEEAAEVVSAPTPEARKEELGDLLFVLANLARHLDIDPEDALRGANAKFERRFHGIEAALAAEDRGPADATLEEMDALWTRMKLIERGELS